jgi:dynein heavy chain
MTALRLSLGISLSGPSGTGKTETIKELSKCAGTQCVVFNCSKEMEYLTVGRFFKALCSCGSWASLEEFNRMDFEVLSVIAQMLQTLLTAKKNNVKDMEFEDSTIKLKNGFNVFITLNPNISSMDMPENLKSLFRPIAMNQAD